MPANGIRAFRAKWILPMTGEREARGKELFSPLSMIDNGYILIKNGFIEAVQKFRKEAPPDCVMEDLGEVCLLPPLANCHCHLSLSRLCGRTIQGAGFVPWLQSLVKELKNFGGLSNRQTRKEFEEGIKAALAQLVESGTGYLGDIGGSLPGATSKIAELAKSKPLKILHFCEWFGFAKPLADGLMPWPERCRQELTNDQELRKNSSPAGHALYSTGEAILRAAKKKCREMGKPFTMHLAESPEENELLADGAGALREFYRDIVLPAEWSAPGLGPLDLALKYELLDENTIAAHGCQLDEKSAIKFSESGAWLCLCPRSNENLGVGPPKVDMLLEKGVKLCLGTDGLSSNSDLDLRNEALFLQERFDIPFRVLVRLMTINGRSALKMNVKVNGLSQGAPAVFSILPMEGNSAECGIKRRRA